MRSLSLTLSQKQCLDLAMLPACVRKEIDSWRNIFSTVQEHAVAKPITVALAAAAEMHGISYKTLVRKYYTLRKTGDLVSLADRRKAKELQSANVHPLPKDFVEFWRGLLERNQRNTSGMKAHRELIRLWRSGQSIPGYPTSPAPDPHTGIPEGWSYRTLIKLKPSRFELTAARIGRSAASHLLPSVYSTRVGILPGQVYVFDDQEYDLRVVFPGAPTRNWFRPVGFNALDLSSGCDFFCGYKPVITDAEGARQKLRQLDFEWFVVGVLTAVGYHPHGTTFIVEHGTSKAGQDFLSRVDRATDSAIHWEASGIHGEQLAGLFRGQPRGNPKHKAHRESWFNLLRNEMAALPSPTGIDRNHDPEESYGLEKYTRQLLDAAATLPVEIVERIRFGSLTWQDFVLTTNTICERINQRTDHALEGWEDLGRVAMEWRLDYDQPWLPEQKFHALPDSRRQLAESLISADPALCRARKLSPAEVWARESQTLCKVSGAMVPILLGPEAARPVKVTARHELIIQDRDISPEPLIYETTLNNSRQLLAGQELSVYLNPYVPTEIQVCDPEGRFLGTAQRVQRICKTDSEALARAYGRVRKLEASLLAPVAARGASQVRERIANMQSNAALLDETPKPTTEERTIIRRARAERGSVSDLIADPDSIPAAVPSQAPCIELAELAGEPFGDLPEDEPTTLADLYS